MDTEHLLTQPPETLVNLVNQTLDREGCTLDQWVQQQAINRESLLRYLEACGYCYLPNRNRVE